MPLDNARRDLLGQRKLTRDQGEYVTHYPATVCSCRRTPGDHPQPTCKVCKGTGRAYTTGVRVRGLIGGVSNQDKSLLTSGLAMPGDMTFSPELNGHTTVHDYDVIRLSYGLPYEGDVLLRGTNDILEYTPTAIQRIEAHDPSTGVTTSYPTGYTIAGRQLSWAVGQGPAAGTPYTVVYLARIDWIVYPGVTLPRMARGQHLGQRVLLRKRHLAGIEIVAPA